ncbi:unnamed protein product [Closterium sp. NIES-65]|nr:unnamed protein product [Closterium sp. NIES-65]
MPVCKEHQRLKSCGCDLALKQEGEYLLGLVIDVIARVIFFTPSRLMSMWPFEAVLEQAFMESPMLTSDVARANIHIALRNDPERRRCPGLTWEGVGLRHYKGVFTIPPHTPMQSYTPFPLSPMFLSPKPSYVSRFAHPLCPCFRPVGDSVQSLPGREVGLRHYNGVFTTPHHTPMQSHTPFPLSPMFLSPKPSYVSRSAHVSALWVIQSRAYLGGSGAKALPGVFTTHPRTPMQSYTPFPLSPMFLSPKPSYVSRFAHVSALWVIQSRAYLGGNGAKALPGALSSVEHRIKNNGANVSHGPGINGRKVCEYLRNVTAWCKAAIMAPSVNGSGPWYKASERAWASSTTGKIYISIDGIEDTEGINRFAQPAPVPAPQPVLAPAGQPVPAPAGQPVPAPAGQPVPAPAGQPVPAPAGQPVLAQAVQPVSFPAFQPVPAPSAQPVPVPAAPFVPVPVAQVASVTSAQAVPVPAAHPGPAPAAQAGPAPVTPAGPVQVAWGDGFLFG